MTIQISDLIVIEGNQYCLNREPGLPENHQGIKAQEYTSPEGEIDFINSTACWRGYQATWEIVEDRLYLSRIKGCWRLRNGERVFADWFSGDLKISLGDYVVAPRGMRPGMRQHETRLTIENGSVVSATTHLNVEPEPVTRADLLKAADRKSTPTFLSRSLEDTRTGKPNNWFAKFCRRFR